MITIKYMALRYKRALDTLGIFILAGTLLIAGNALAQSPELSTDKADYHPGETVTIFGNFFDSLQEIVLKIFATDENGGNYTESNINIVTDALGAFTTSYTLDNVFRPLYTVIASALDGNQLAQTTFTDAPFDDFSQCQNDPSNTNSKQDCVWTNGGLNANNSFWNEGEVVPHRYVITGLTENNTYTLRIQHEFSKANLYFYDFLSNASTTQNTPSLLNACGQVPNTGQFAGFAEQCNTLLPVAIENLMPSDSFGAVGKKVSDFETSPRKIKAIGASSVSVNFANPAHSANGACTADNTCGTSTVDLLITFTPTKNIGKAGNIGAAFWWGGHLAEGEDWGAGFGAASVSGAPSHMKIIELCSGPHNNMTSCQSLGQKDNQIQNAVILPQQAHLTLVKQIVNDNGGTAAATDLTLSASGPTNISGITGSASVTNAAVNAGTYTLSESNGPANYTASTYSCVKNNAAPVSGNSITLAAGDNATCTITNNDNAPQLHLRKTVTNNNGGNAAATAWTLTATGASQNPTNLSGSTPVDSESNFKADTYALAETGGPSGYTASAWNCGNATMPDTTHVEVSFGENVTCTIMNDDQPGTLHVVKVVDNGNTGATNGPSFFSFQVNGGNITAFESDGQNDMTVNADTYNVTEPAVSGYSTQYSNCSNIVISNGGEGTCTITNTAIAPTLKLIKTVVNDNGGTLTENNFPRFIDGNSVSWNVAVPVTVGSHTASETAQTGYAASVWGTDCASNGTVTLALGDNKVCTITNDDIQPKLTVTKILINNNGGNAVISDFPLFVDNSPVTSGIQNTFNAGAHTVSETQLAGYAMTGITGDCAADGSITLQPGDVKACTITNDDQPAHIVLIKNVVKDNGGTAGVNDFGLKIDGNNTTSGATVDVDSNTAHAINETGLAGYDFVSITGDPKCPAILGGTVTLNEGETVTCTITNDDQEPKLTLKKVVINDNGGGVTEAQFTLTATGPTGFSGAGPTVLNGISFDAGTYDLSETNVPGYSASAWVCDTLGAQVDADTVNVGLGQNITCTITNDDIAPSLTLNKIVVKDNGGSAIESAWTLTATGNQQPPVILSGPGAPGNTDVVSGATFQAGTYTLTESTGPDGYTASDWSCVKNNADAVTGSSITLGIGDAAVCTITNDDQPGKLLVHKSTLPTTDTTQFSITVNGTPVSGSATQNIINGGTVDYILNAGTYSVSETDLAGWDEDVSDCQSEDVKNGGTMECTITNVQKGKITIVKDAQENDCKDFDFTMGQNTFTLDDDEGATECIIDPENQEKSKTFVNLEVNTSYTITETPEDFWTLQNPIVCTGVNESQVTQVANGVTINLLPGNEAVCTFVNDKIDATRTQGFWKTHTNFTSKIFDTFFMPGGMMLGNLSYKKMITDVHQLFAVWFSDVNFKTTLIGNTKKQEKRTNVEKARILLAHQLVTAKLNCAAFGGCSVTTNSMINSADNAYAGNNVNDMNFWAGKLDEFNNSGDTIIITPPSPPQGKATPKESKEKASTGLLFWDNP